MASPDPVSTPEQLTPPLVCTPEQKSSPELLAPSGWRKKVGSSKKGSTPSKRDVSFIAPDGEEIKSRKALDAYIKSHPGCPPASAFDWGTGETPTRRSTRLSSMTRPSLNSPEGGSAEKRQRKTVEDTSKHVEKQEPEEPVAKEPEEPVATEDLPPETDEIIEELTKCEDKLVEEVPSHMGGELNELEAGETPAGVNIDTKNGVGEKEIITEGKSVHDSTGCTPKKESAEAKESSDKLSDVFQHCPEAPDASKQVDVST